MDLGLKDAKVLVTAASKGLGAATARQFALEGSQVAICSRKKTEVTATAESIRKESGQPIYPFVADVAQIADVQRVVDEAASALGGLDVLVCNAGGAPPGGFVSLSVGRW